MLTRFYADLVAITGFILLCASIISFALLWFNAALTLFVGAIIFIAIGFYLIEFYKKEDERPSK